MLNIKVVQIGKLIYTKFLGFKMAAPKIVGSVWPYTSHMPKASLVYFIV